MIPDFPIVDLPASATASREAAIAFLLQHLARIGDIPIRQLAGIEREVLKREQLGSTAIGRGVAFPHCKSEMVDNMAGVVGKAEKGIHWQHALDHSPVHVVMLVICAAARPGDCLRVLEEMARRL